MVTRDSPYLLELKTYKQRKHFRLHPLSAQHPNWLHMKKIMRYPSDKTPPCGRDHQTSMNPPAIVWKSERAQAWDSSSLGSSWVLQEIGSEDFLSH